MSDSIREEITDKLIPYMRDSERYAIADSILKLITESLPKEKKFDSQATTKEISDARVYGFNVCLRKIKKSLSI